MCKGHVFRGGIVAEGHPQLTTSAPSQHNARELAIYIARKAERKEKPL